MKGADLFRNPDLCKTLLDKIAAILDGRQMRFMEVCGTHTVSIFQSGLRSLLPGNIHHLSGPGCPVCVTHEAEIALFLELARQKDIILATFGDLLRVPGPDGASLKNAHADGAKISIVYSPLDAVNLARENPASEVIFLGVGFETTAPTVAASILTASRLKLANFSVLSFHKLVPPALRAICSSSKEGIDAFLLPGHVATVTGLNPFGFLAKDYSKPGVVGGFEPVDILLALEKMAEQIMEGKAVIENAYPRGVDNAGNNRAMELLKQVFKYSDASWRGMGNIPKSGLAIRGEFEDYDTMRKFQLQLPAVSPSPCKCGEVLQGRIEPPQCPLFGRKCTPAKPVGPCMVSTEGSCAAYFKYGV